MLIFCFCRPFDNVQMGNKESFHFDFEMKRCIDMFCIFIYSLFKSLNQEISVKKFPMLASLSFI